MSVPVEPVVSVDVVALVAVVGVVAVAGGGMVPDGTVSSGVESWSADVVLLPHPATATATRTPPSVRRARSAGRRMGM